MRHEPTASRMDPAWERDLVARSRADRAAFAQLYDFYLPRIHGFAMRRLGDREAAEDVAATTFERALSALLEGEFRNESFGGWLYRVASNAIVDHARRRARTMSLGGPRDDGSSDGDETLGDETAAAAFASALERDALRRALLALPARHRRIVVLKFFDGLTTEELCAVLECTPQALAMRLHRAVLAMREALAREATDAA